MTNYMLITYDADQQQTFWDLVPATSEAVATDRIEKLRPYAVVVEVLTPDILRSITDHAATCSIEEAEARRPLAAPRSRFSYGRPPQSECECRARCHCFGSGIMAEQARP